MLASLSIDPTVIAGCRLGGGVHREGYRLTIDGQDFCVKVASYRGANREEAMGWESLKGTDDESLFAEVIAADPTGAWLIMPFCEALATEGRPAGYDSDEEANDAGWYEEGWGWWYHEDFYAWEQSPEGERANEITSDLHAFNVMRHPDGRIVVTDYGMGVLTRNQGEWGGPAWDEDSNDARTCRTCAERRDAFAAPASDEEPSYEADSRQNCRASWRNDLVVCPSCGWNIPVGRGRAKRTVCRCNTCLRHRRNLRQV